MVTGGFRSREGCNRAILDHSADLIGLARPACLEPLSLPGKLFDRDLPDDQAVCVQYRLKGIKILQSISPIKVVGAGFTTSKLTHASWNQADYNAVGFWFQLFRLGRGQEPDLDMSFAKGFFTELLPKILGIQ